MFVDRTESVKINSELELGKGMKGVAHSYSYLFCDVGELEKRTVHQIKNYNIQRNIN